MLRSTLLAISLTSVASWATCDFPTVDWVVVDSGVGKSATQKVTTLGTTTFIGGYAGGQTTLKSSASTTTVTNTESDWLSPCGRGCSQTGEMDMHISKIADDGTPQAIYIFEGSGLGSAPGWSMLHGMEDGLHIAAALSLGGNITLPSGVLVENKATSGSTGVVIKIKSDGSVPWHVKFDSSAGSSVSSVDGDYAGNMFVNYRTCVPCVSNCVPGVDGYGRPTGMNAPTCTRFLTKLNHADGSAAWTKTLPDTINPGYIRLQRTGSGDATKMFAWGSVDGASVTLDSCTLTSAAGGSESQAVIFEIDASNGVFNWCFAPTGDVAVSPGYMDLSPSTSSPVLVVQGGFSGTVAFGATSLTAAHGYYTSFIARLSTSDGSVTWAEQTPMSRGVQVTPDGAYVGVFCQTTGTSDRVELTDASGVTTTVRSRGSWDLIAVKLDAINGNGVYAMDGGGDSMEYFHGFGMNSQGDMLISGYSRSSSFHFGDKSLTNTQSAAAGGAGDNKIFTIQVSATSSTPSCITSCASNTPVIQATSCFIDNYCYADNTVAPYPARSCFKCDASASQTDWTGPDVTAHCFITGYNDGGVCYANGDSKAGPTSRSPPSQCQACIVEKATDAWSIRDGYDLVSGACVAVATISTTTTEALTAAMAASTKVKEITGSTGLSTSFAAAKTLYVGSVLQTLARTSWAGATDYDLAVAYYNSTTFLDDYMLSALDGTGQFAGSLDAARGDMSAARTEAVKKGLQDQILVMAALSSVAASPTTEANWDLAYAYYNGDSPSGAPFARANKRAANYGTVAADGTTAKLNFQVMDAIAAGKTACTANEDGTADAAAAAAAYADFRALVLGIYYQASLRYGYLLDKDITDATATADHQGEGGAFWRIVAPLMHSKDPLLTQYVSDFYNMANAPAGTGKRYCPLLHLLSNHLLAGFTSSDMGALTAASGVICFSGVQAPATPSTALISATSASSEVKLVTGSGGLGNATNPFGKARAIFLASTLAVLAKTDYDEGHEGHDHGDGGMESYGHINAEYFGSETWIHDYMMTALDATGQFAGSLDAARGDMSAARTEAVKKGAQDQILVHAAIGSLKNPQVADSWYMFYAYWTGETPSGAPWARANKRCKNYATCGGGTTGGGGELATTNSKILLATLSALDNPASNGAAAKMTAIAQVKVVYYQAALRYAYLLNNDIATEAATADHQGEGGAFWRVIEAEMAEIDGKTASYVSRFYNMTTVPSGTSRYCPLAALLHANMPAGLPVSEMGVLQGSSVTLPTCPAVVTASTEGAQKTKMTIKADGAAADYDANAIAAVAAKELNVLPQQMAVTVAADSRRRKLQSGGGVTITIEVFTANANDAAAIKTKLVDMAGTASKASTFLSTATGRTVTVSKDPAAPTSNDASAQDEPSKDSGGCGGGCIGGIIGGVSGSIFGVIGIVIYMKKKKEAGRVKVVNAGA